MHELRWIITRLDREVEGIKNGLGFAGIVKELETLEVIDQSEAAWLLGIYGRIRTPLHHGISGRILDLNLEKKELLDNPKIKEEMSFASIFTASPDMRINQFEEFIDCEVTPLLEQIVNFLAAHHIPRSRW